MLSDRLGTVRIVRPVPAREGLADYRDRGGVDGVVALVKLATATEWSSQGPKETRGDG
jgi:hypothetical protein